jgi:hypothetical protein
MRGGQCGTPKGSAETALLPTIDGEMLSPMKLIRRILTAIIGPLLCLGCFKSSQEIPAEFLGEYSFDTASSIAYWNSQSEWPSDVKEKLIKMALPTTFRIEKDKVVITDVASGQSQTQRAKVLKAGPQLLQLELFSNFAGSTRTTTLNFDSEGFWLCEGTLFPNYRERFARSLK